MGQNLVEKIAQRFAVDLEPDHRVLAGDYLSMRPRHVLAITEKLQDRLGTHTARAKSVAATSISGLLLPLSSKKGLDRDVR